ncbi:MAG: hypothetical protein Q9194_004098, partial [Teloschistes cf. exilis]
MQDLEGLSEDMSPESPLTLNDLLDLQFPNPQTTAQASDPVTARDDDLIMQSLEADEIDANMYDGSPSHHVPSKRRSASPIPVDGMDLGPAPGAALYGTSQGSQQPSLSYHRMSTRASTARQRASITQPRTVLFKEVLYFHKPHTCSVSVEKELVKVSNLSPQQSPVNTVRSPNAKRRRAEIVSNSTNQLNALESSGQEVADADTPKAKSLAQDSILRQSGPGTAALEPKIKLPSQGHPASSDISDDHPFSLLARRADIVFLSQMIPRHFDQAAREGVIELVQRHASYIPLCIAQIDSTTRRKTVWDSMPSAAKKRKSKPSPKFRCPLGSEGGGWPVGQPQNPQTSGQALPVEIFEMIAQSLSRDDVKKMRLVNREFERKISCYAFRSVVVPFKPKIYGSSDSPSPEPPMRSRDQKTVSNNAKDLERTSFRDTYDPKESHVKDGMRVFDQWGPEIKKFALAFEVDESSLINLPTKKHTNVKKAFWGSYEWPHAYYNRFAQAERYEKKADEISRMSAAFSKLTGLRELGLSIISGQGWLAGPDVSDRVKILERQPEVFGSYYAVPDQRARGCLDAWEKIVQQETRKVMDLFYTDKVQRCFFAAMRKRSTMNPKVEFVHKAPAKDSIRPPIMFRGQNSELRLQRDNMRDLNRYGIDGYRIGPSENTAASALESSDIRLIPNKLTAEQEEWLLEMEWAQTAFLSSWCISVLDNRSTFSSLTTFNVANLSSKYLSCLHRLDIWRSLPSLEKFTLLVSPDWRRLELDYKDEAVSQRIQPSSAHSEFNAFLCLLFGGSSNPTNIKTLKVGFVGGGEHALGMYARNKNILPAPIMAFEPITRNGPDVRETVAMKKIQHFTLKNCWITPQAMRQLFSSFKENDAEMQTVTFDSVSMTADTAYTTAELLALQSSMEPSNSSGRPERLNHWLHHDPLHGSWADMINLITPGPGIKHARHLHYQETQDGQPPASPIPHDPNGTPSPDSHPYGTYNPSFSHPYLLPGTESDSESDHPTHHYPLNSCVPIDRPKSILRTITFLSCGYARLPSFPSTDGWCQSPVPEPIISPPDCVKAR